jgi:hypothetical protein
VPINGVSQVWLSDVVGAMSPLGGHSLLSDVWNLKIVFNGEAPGTFGLDVEATARLEIVVPTSNGTLPVTNVGGSTATWPNLIPTTDLVTNNYKYAEDDFSMNVIDCQLSGKFEYYGDATLPYPNVGINPLNNLTLTLMDGASTVATTTTLGDGTYLFLSIPSGTFEMHVSTLKTTAGALNSTDAAQVASWGIAAPKPTIERIVYKAGNVNQSFLSLNSGDAAPILDRFVNGTPWQFVDDWVFWYANTQINQNNLWSSEVYPTVTISGASATQDFYGLVSGDFNRSFVPSAALVPASPYLSLQDGIVRPVGPNTTILMPVSMGNGATLGAASIILNYPADKLEILSVFLGNDPNNPVIFNAKNGELRIGWTDLNGLALASGQTFITLEVKTKTAITMGETIRFTLAQDPLNELADANNQVILNGLLSIDVLKVNTVGLTEGDVNSQLGLANYPNPFADQTTFAYSLPHDGKVTLEIYDLIGQRVATVIHENQTTGQHTITVDGSMLTTGVYMATLRLETSGTVLSRTIRIISH